MPETKVKTKYEIEKINNTPKSIYSTIKNSEGEEINRWTATVQPTEENEIDNKEINKITSRIKNVWNAFVGMSDYRVELVLHLGGVELLLKMLENSINTNKSLILKNEKLHSNPF